MRHLAVFVVLLLAACSTSTADPKDAGDDVDGQTGGADADDSSEADADVTPECPEIREPVENTCDGLDNDCDGTIDNVANPPPWFRDGDGDGAGGGAATRFGCVQPQGFVATGGDCDDGDASIAPGHAEWCDGLDNDCSGDPAETCPDECQVRIREDGRRYLFCSLDRTYEQGRATCSGNGFKMVRIDDDTENNWVRATANPIDGGLWRLGGADVTTEGTWAWDDGTAFWQGRADGALVGGLFARWNSGEPNDASANEDCTEMRGDGSWNDVPCGNNLAFICERYEIAAP